MSKNFRVFVSIILSLGVWWLWAYLIGIDANRLAGDNGSDTFGTLHLLFLFITSPFLIYFSSKFIYKFLKPKNTRN